MNNDPKRVKVTATEVFAYFLVFIFVVYDGLVKYAERQRIVWEEPWKRLTRSLKPTQAQLYAETLAEHNRVMIALSNQDVHQYNYKTWWNEYKWLRHANVN